MHRRSASSSAGRRATAQRKLHAIRAGLRGREFPPRILLNPQPREPVWPAHEAPETVDAASCYLGRSAQTRRLAERKHGVEQESASMQQEKTTARIIKTIPPCMARIWFGSHSHRTNRRLAISEWLHIGSRTTRRSITTNKRHSFRMYCRPCGVGENGVLWTTLPRVPSWTDFIGRNGENGTQSTTLTNVVGWV